MLAALWLGSTPLVAPVARAACNAIPTHPDTFRGAVGALDRPFAGAGDRVVARPACDSPLLSDVDGDDRVGPSDVMVTLVFEPPEGGSRHVVVLTGAKECPVTDACAPTPVNCITAAPGLTASASEVAFDLPDTSGLFPGVEAWDLTGSTRVAVTPSNAPAPCGLARGDCTQASPPGAFACVDALFDPVPQRPRGRDHALRPLHGAAPRERLPGPV